MNGQSRNSLKRARRRAQELRRVEKGKRQDFVLVRCAELMLGGMPAKAARQAARMEYDRETKERLWPEYAHYRAKLAEQGGSSQ